MSKFDATAYFRNVKTAREDVKTKGTDKGRFALPQGEGYVDGRLLMVPGGLPFVAVPCHFINNQILVSPNTKDSRGYLTGPDPIVEASQVHWRQYNAAKKRGDKEAMDVAYKTAKSLSPTWRYTWIALDVANLDDGPKLLTMSQVLHDLVVDAIAGNPTLGDEGLGDVFDFDTGRNLRIVRSKGNGGFMVFDKSKFLAPSAIGTPEQRKQWIENAPDLEKLAVPASIEVLQQALAEFTGGLAPLPVQEPTAEPINRDAFEAALMAMDKIA